MADLAEAGGRVRTFLRERGLATGLELLVNFILPFLIYRLTQKGLGDVHALMASSAPPIAWSIFEFARHRRIDALSILVLAGIALSLLAYLGGGSAKVLQLREKLVTVTIGLVFLGSVLIGRPLIYELARATMRRRNDAEQLASFEAMRDNAGFKRVMRTMTLVWGFGLVGEAAVATALVFKLTIGQYLLVGPILGYSTMGALSFWTFLYARASRRRGEAAARAAEAAAQVQADAGAEPSAAR
jgi:hypothetical protein